MTRIVVLGTALVFVWCLCSESAIADDLTSGGLAADWGAGVTDGELGQQSGLGVSVSGSNNSVAQSEATGTINGEVVSDAVNTGQITNLQTNNVSGFNIYQTNTGNNVNQIVSQAVNLYFADQP